MVSVKMRDGLNYFDLDGENFSLKVNEIKVIPDKFLKMYEIKEALFNGRLRIAEGAILLNIKDAKVYFDSNNVIYGLEYGKFFKKDLESDSILEWINPDDVSVKVPQPIFEVLMNLKDIEVKPKEEKNPLDLNNDGQVNAEDAVLASKVMNAEKKSRKKK